jgi:hypothetical protein
MTVILIRWSAVSTSAIEGGGSLDDLCKSLAKNCARHGSAQA